MKKFFTLTLSSLLIIPALSHAEYKSGFADIGLHYLDWTSETTEKTSKKSHKDDFGYLELEGGANFSWGEMYGFFDWENFYNGRHAKPGSEQRYTFKNTNRIYLGDTGLNLYLHAYGTYGSPNRAKEGANKRGNSSRLTQSFHFFMFEPIFSPVNALNQPI